MNITCGKNHSGNKSLHKHGKGWECAGCGQHFTREQVTAAFRNAKREMLKARSLGYSGTVSIG